MYVTTVLNNVFNRSIPSSQTIAPPIVVANFASGGVTLKPRNLLDVLALGPHLQGQIGYLQTERLHCPLLCEDARSTPVLFTRLRQFRARTKEKAMVG
jgi:hypothetical protein